MRLIPAQYVKPYVKTNKSDYLDAEAIAEAVGRPTMRFVPIKSDDQLDLQSLHRVRERWVSRRTAVINQIRGLLLERGITVRKGRRYIEAALPGILEDADAKLSGALRLLLAQLKLELDQTALRLEEADALIERTAQERSLPTTGEGPGNRAGDSIRAGAGPVKCAVLQADQPDAVPCRQDVPETIVESPLLIPVRRVGSVARIVRQTLATPPGRSQGQGLAGKAPGTWPAAW